MLVVVSGLPGAGKTTLSRRLADDLGFVVIVRDALKPLFEGIDERGQGRGAIPRATDRLVNHFAGAVLDAGHGVVIDNNFNWPEQHRHVVDLVAERQPPCFEVCLWGDARTLRQRWLDRECDNPYRDASLTVLDRALARERKPVLGPPAPTVEIDTTDLTVIDSSYDALLAEIRSVTCS